MARSAKETDSENIKHDAPADVTERRNYFSSNNQKGVLYGLLAFVVLLAVFALAAAAANHHRNLYRTTAFAGGPSAAFAGPIRGGERGFITGGMYVANTSGESRLMGVVTSVSGSGFTVAGHGSTTTSLPTVPPSTRMATR